MKVLLIDNYFYRKGGAEVVFLNTGNLLSERGHEVVYFSQTWDKNLPCNQALFFSKGRDLNASSIRDKIKALCHYFYNREAAKKLEKLIKAECPDIAHIHLFWGGISPSIFRVLKKHKIPIVHTAHDYRMICPAYSFKDGKGRICERCGGGAFFHCILRRCAKGKIIESIVMAVEMYMRYVFLHPARYVDRFIFVSEFSRKKHFQYDKRFALAKSVTLYNFQDSSVLNQNGEGSVNTFNSYYLYYGRLSREKGIATLLRSVSRCPSVLLKIVGAGPLEKELKNLCKDESIQNVQFVGFKSGQELYEIVQGAKFVCVPSEWFENNPMAIIEAYTLHTPVIGATIGGIPEIIEDGRTGFCFESGNSNALLQAIERSEMLTQEEYSEMKKEAAKFAKQKFDPESYYKRLIQLYEEVLKLYR